MIRPVNFKHLFDVYSALTEHIGAEQAIWAAGQGALESNWYTSGLSISALNFWGIKATPSWTGAIWTSKTEEYQGGKFISVVQQFRKYPDIRTSTQDYLSLISRRYGSPLNQPRLEIFLIHLQGRWATDPLYSTKVSRATNEVRRIIASPQKNPA